MAPTDESDDAEGYVPPLPPEDRLWRHPSEMASGTAGGHAATASPSSAGTETTADPARRGQRQTLVLSAIAGVIVTLGVLTAMGTFHRDDADVAVEQVAVEPPRDPAALERLGPALARLDTTRGGEDSTTTAVVYRSDGYLLAAADSVADADELTVTLGDGRVLPATFVGADPVSGVAVVKVEAGGLVTAVLGTDDAARPGDQALAVSLPPDPAASPMVFQGQVTGTGWRLDSTEGTHHDLIRAALEADPPSTGGAVLCSLTGTVLGMLLPDQAGTARPLPTAATNATAPTVLARTTDGESTAHFATPISLALRVADEMVATGRAHYAWLGVQGEDLDVDRAADLGRSGAVLTDIEADGPADRGGLRRGDLVTALDDQPVRSISELVIALRERRPGDAVDVTYQRDDETRRAAITLADSAR